MGELLGFALPPRLQGRILDLDLVRRVWRSALPEVLGRKACPTALARGVLTIVAADAATAAEARRQRKTIRERLLRAAGLPGANLRLRVREDRPPVAGAGA